MEAVKIKENVYWVGGIDWNLRNFHGYLTERGSTYNAYLIIDEKITLIDTVKHYLFDEMIQRISSVIDPSKIDQIISNHVEMDHSGSFVKLKELVPNAKIYCSPNGEKGLVRHFKKDLDYQVVKTGDSITTGNRSLSFLLTPMVHWPDNMVTYCPEDKILFSNDSFGQHVASSERFDDEYPLDITLEAAMKYYANIVLPYGAQVQKALTAAANLDIEIICPSHGLMWRKHLAKLLEKYQTWSTNTTEEKAVIIYDTMWGSTEKMAYAIKSGFDAKGVPADLCNLTMTHISDVMTKIAEAKYICVGSPTLNNNMLPTVAAFLTYLKGLAPQNRKSLAFGSFGWGGQSVGLVADDLAICKFEPLLEKMQLKFIPDQEELEVITAQVAAAL